MKRKFLAADTGATAALEPGEYGKKVGYIDPSEVKTGGVSRMGDLGLKMANSMGRGRSSRFRGEHGIDRPLNSPRNVHSRRPEGD